MQGNIRISHLIPLYRSARFIDSIAHNVFHLARPTSEIILADRNGDTALCDMLRVLFAGLPNVTVLCDDTDVSWVGNIQGLMAQVQGTYFQIVPHDDKTSRHAVDQLCDTLDASPDAVLAYGKTQAYDMSWNRIGNAESRDIVDDRPSGAWHINDSLEMLWTGRFNGAFKGVIRADVLKKQALAFKASQTTILSERAWLAALAMTGRLAWVPLVMLEKRFYPESTHRQWVVTPEVIDDLRDMLIDYATTIFATSPERRNYAVRSIVANAGWQRYCVQSGAGLQKKFVSLGEEAAPAGIQQPITWSRSTVDLQ